MDKFNKNIGLRLKKIRKLFNEGSGLSSTQFAHLLQITGDKIRNYEIGRAALPVSVLYTLYKKGINPTYVISGEGTVFAANSAGKSLRTMLYGRGIYPDANRRIEISVLDAENANFEAEMMNVAAGRINIDDFDNDD